MKTVCGRRKIADHRDYQALISGCGAPSSPPPLWPHDDRATASDAHVWPADRGKIEPRRDHDTVLHAEVTQCSSTRCISSSSCPGWGLSLWASARVKRTFNRYAKVWSRRGSTGAQAAVALLRGAGITDVQIVRAHGVLSDHYNPVTKKLALSEPVYASDSIAAVGVATHEAGHAIQHARHYAPLWVRSALVPTASIGSSFGYGAMAIGLFLASTNLVRVGAVLFSAVLLFQVVTLPVEFNASNRAKALTVEHGIITAQEREGVDRVLNAAALTYVAAAVSTLLTLLHFLWRAGLLGGRR